MIQILKKSIMTVLFIGLITSNILTLVYQPFSSAISSLILSTLGISTAFTILEAALETKSLEIDKYKKVVATKEKMIRNHQKQVLNRKLAVTQHFKSIAKRTKKMISRAIASIPAKAIPVIGTGAVLGGLAYEIHVTCENLKDIQLIQLECDVSETLEKSIMEKVCDQF